MDWRFLALHVFGVAISVVLTYKYVWTVPWLLIILGFYLLGLVLSLAWKEWFGAYYLVLPGFILIGSLFAFLGLTSNVSNILFGQWCAIKPCMPMFVPIASCFLASVFGIIPYYVWEK